MHGPNRAQPVRTGRCPNPADYLVSSQRCDALGQGRLLMHPHHDYQRVGTTREQRCAACHAIIVETLSNEKFTPSGSTCNAGMRLEQIAFAPPSKRSCCAGHSGSGWPRKAPTE